MLASSRLRGHRVTVPVIAGIAFLTCVTKMLLVQDSFSYIPGGYGRTENFQGDFHPINGQAVVRMESALSIPLNVSGRHGQMVISVNADDLDEIAERTLPNQIPHPPNILLHNPDICHSTASLRFLIYVHSSPVHRIKRDLLRRTYANTRLFRDRRFIVLFFLGLSQENGVQQLVRSEFEEHGDIVQGFFVDHYRNMTLKAVMALNWIRSHCSEAGFAFKVDDDTFINIFQILPLIETASVNQTLFLACPMWRERSMRILRNRKNCMKWCVTKRELRGEYYPKYCAGITYVMSQPLIEALKERAKVTPFFWIDDVYVTGFLPEPFRDRIHYVNLIGHFELFFELALQRYSNKSMPLVRNIVHVTYPPAFRLLWNYLLRRLTPDERAMANEEALRPLP